MALDVKEPAKKVPNPQPPKNGESDPSNKMVSKKKEEANEKAPKANLRTTKPVEFSVNGKMFKGTEFSVPKDSLLERQNDLRAQYGKDIIAEE